MPSTTYAEFNDSTEGLDVAKVFGDGIRDKTILVTGANLKGIGFTTAQAFASQSPKTLILAGRNATKIQDCVDALASKYAGVNYRFLQVDLSSQKSVRQAAGEVMSWEDVPSIDIVVNCAGIMLLPERTLSEDGIEMHFATNHIGHFLLTNLIMPKLVKAAESNHKGATRIVNVSSASPIMGENIRWSDRNFDKKSNELPENERPHYPTMNAWGLPNPAEMDYIPIEGYYQSKVANLLYSIGLTKRLFDKHGILSLAVNPGVIDTDLGADMPAYTKKALAAMRKEGTFPFKSQGAGSSTSLVAALDPKLGYPVSEGGIQNYGAYLGDCQICKALPGATSTANAERLWKESEELVNEKFAW